MKARQITFRETGGTAFGQAQFVAFTLRGIYDYTAERYYSATEGTMASPAGSWADTVYVTTDAPIHVVRRVVRKDSTLTIRAK